MMPVVPHTLKGRRTFTLPCLSTLQQCLCSSIPEQSPGGAAAPRGPLAGQDAEVSPRSSALLLRFRARFLPPRGGDGTRGKQHVWA